MIPLLAAIVIGTILLMFAVQVKAQEFDDMTAQNKSVNSRVKRLALAIARAEGYGIEGAIPTLANNPGDLVLPHWTGETLGASISVLDADTPDDPLEPNGGWHRLYNQINLILEGRSHVYSLHDSILDMAQKWTETEQNAWAINVADYLGVGTNTPLSALLTGPEEA